MPDSWKLLGQISAFFLASYILSTFLLSQCISLPHILWKLECPLQQQSWRTHDFLIQLIWSNCSHSSCYFLRYLYFNPGRSNIHDERSHYVGKIVTEDRIKHSLSRVLLQLNSVPLQMLLKQWSNRATRSGLQKSVSA